MSGDRDLTQREARDRFLARRKSENTANTIRGYKNRLTRFVEWSDQAGVESMSELDGWLLDEYRAHREDVDVAPTTLKGQLVALKQLLDFCASVDVVDDDLPEKVQIPDLSKDEETSDDMLEVATRAYCWPSTGTQGAIEASRNTAFSSCCGTSVRESVAPVHSTWMTGEPTTEHSRSAPAQPHD